MTFINKFYFVGIMGALILTIVSGALTANAGQTSLNDILEMYEQIDERTNIHERDAAQMRSRLANLAQEMEAAREQLSNPVSDSDPDVLKKRRVMLQAKMTEIAADYLNQAYKLLDSAAGVIAANLMDITKLTARIRESGDPSGGAEQLRTRIEDNITAGRSMRGALEQLRVWAREDPGLVRRFQSLQRITQTLDAGISVDMARLSGRRTGGSIQNKQHEALDQAVDRLSDMYAEVLAEKEALRGLRDDVSVAIQLGRLQMTQQVIESAIPNLGSPKAPLTGLDSLAGMAMVMGELNDSIFAETGMPDVGRTTTPGQFRPARLEIFGFQNF